MEFDRHSEDATIVESLVQVNTRVWRKQRDDEGDLDKR